MSGQKKRPAVSAAGLGTPLGSEYPEPITIPAEGVEAAWNAMPLDAYVDNQEQVRAMLEAAAPHITARAVAYLDESVRMISSDPEAKDYERGFDDAIRGMAAKVKRLLNGKPQ